MAVEPSENFSRAFTEANLEQIQGKTFVQQVEYRRELASTNDLALELAGDPGRLLPLLVLAEFQTAGRGRRANRWWSAQGALTFSLVLDTKSLSQNPHESGQRPRKPALPGGFGTCSKTAQLPPVRWPQVSLTAGLAVCEALEQLLPQLKIQLKWPNDVYVQRQKVSGILLEIPRQQPGKIVLGIGINVNNSLTNAPNDISKSATALCDIAGRPFSREDVLIGVLRKLEQRLSWIGSQDHALRDLWRKRCLLTDQRVQIETVSERLVGLCQGIDEEGALLLQTKEGVQGCFAGTVTLLES